MSEAIGSLFDDIIKATEDKDIDSINSIIEKYMPLILKYSKKSFSNEIDEDLKQTIIMSLGEKIPHFKVKVQ